MGYVAVETIGDVWHAPLSEWERINHLLETTVHWIEFTTLDGADVKVRADRIIAVARLTDDAVRAYETRSLTQGNG